MFTPRYIKHSRLLLRHAEKMVRYRKDLLSEATLSDLKAQIKKLEKAVDGRDQKAVKEESELLHKLYLKHMPTPKDAAWRENIEVLLVAIVVAFGIRSYFIQPFKIPTGSMQPTLNGIIGHPMNEPPPNILRQVAEFVILGRNYVNEVSAQDDTVEQVVPTKISLPLVVIRIQIPFFTLSEIRWAHQKPTTVYASPDTLRQDFKVVPGARYNKGDVIARGAIDTGDQVFVDKFSYNFVKPHRGDVFVFRTDNIVGIPADPETGAPFYIKRLSGIPGDTLRIDPPLLYVNEKPAEGLGFGRVMAAKDGYRGYAPGREYLADRTKPYTVPERHYFAMGDNSYNSLDSRWWGPVPEENLVGRGLLVYWPFNRHWGLIR